MNVKYAVFVLGIALSCTHAAGAIDKSVTLSLSAEWEDNANKSSFNRESDLVTNLGLDVKVGEDFGGYEYGILYNIEHQRYQDDTFDSSNYLNGTAFLNLNVIPHRVFWDNSISSAVTLLNAVQPDVPDNRDQRNTIYTAPRFVIMQSTRDSLTVSANAEKIMFREVNENDNTRLGADVVYSHRLTSLVTSGVSCNAESASFDSDGDYENYSCYLNVDRRINNGNISLAIGKTVIDPDNGQKIDGLVYDARMNWSADNNSLYFTARRNITDTSFGIELEGFDQSFSPIIFNTEQVYLTRRSRAELGASRSVSSITTVSGNLYWDLDDVEDSPADTIRTGLVLNYSRELPEDCQIRFDYRFEKTEFNGIEELQTIDFTSIYRLTMNHSFSRNLEGEVYLLAENRRADIEIDEYEMYGIGASVQYEF